MHYYFEIVQGIETGRRYILAPGSSSIGRSHMNTLTIHAAEKSVSAHHAMLSVSPGNIIIEDLTSTNGLFVNETETSSARLAAGDIVGFGAEGPRLRLCESATPPAFTADTDPQGHGAKPWQIHTSDERTDLPDHSHGQH